MTEDERLIGALLHKGARILEDSGIENNVAESRHLMMLYTGDDLASMYMKLDQPLDEFTAMRYMNAIRKRATHYPLQYITGFTYFMDREFDCRENVLIPRYDTEALVYRALDMSPDRDARVLDMCTGSGCIGVSYKLERMEQGYDDEVTLVDISDDALALAADNAEKQGVRVNIVKSDMYEAFLDRTGRPRKTFDVILCNPPYIKTFDISFLIKDVRDYEPRLALDGSKDGLAFYRILISRAREFLTEQGIIVLEIGSEQYLDVYDMLREEGFNNISRIKDMSGLDRVVSAELND